MKFFRSLHQPNINRTEHSTILVKGNKEQKILTQTDVEQTKENINNKKAAANLIDLSRLKPGDGFVINGITEKKPSTELFGSIANAGDVNGDGFDDIVLSTPDAYINNKVRVGQSYVIFGDQNIGDSGDFDLNKLDGNNGFIIQGIDEYDRAGEYVANAGDLNNDGFDDIIIGAPPAEPDNKRSTGETYVVFGDANLGSSGNLQLSELNGSNGLILRGVGEYDRLGSAVDNAGDINGDGLDDLVIGAPFASSNSEEGKKSYNQIASGSEYESQDRGEVYVVFGNAQLGYSGDIQLSELDGSNGFTINCGENSRNCGTSVSNAGDINGDGIDDVIVSAKYDSKSYVVFGDSQIAKSGSLKLSELNGSNGFLLEDADEDSFFGRSVSNAGDVNDDGIDDLVIGASLATANGETRAGKSYIIFGSENLGNTGKLDVNTLDGRNGFTISISKQDYLLGHSVSNAGDVNDDGVDDIVINAPGVNISSQDNIPGGKGYVVFGDAQIGSSGSLNLSQLDSDKGLVLDGYGSHLRFISDDGDDRSTNNSISNAGDINGDGIADVVIGIPGASDAGDSYVIFGNRRNIANSFESEHQTTNPNLNNDSVVFEGNFVLVLLVTLVSIFTTCLLSRKTFKKYIIKRL